MHELAVRHNQVLVLRKDRLKTTYHRLHFLLRILCRLRNLALFFPLERSPVHGLGLFVSHSSHRRRRLRRFWVLRAFQRHMDLGGRRLWCINIRYAHDAIGIGFAGPFFSLLVILALQVLLLPFLLLPFLLRPVVQERAFLAFLLFNGDLALHTTLAGAAAAVVVPHDAAPHRNCGRHREQGAGANQPTPSPRSVTTCLSESCRRRCRRHAIGLGCLYT
mmetsp:Transcript_216/g.535  ORF Transcript_216/g.535 Transcript_216/m.535 type:complete len:219 (-) Transcript_216:117-773(-)